MLRATSVVVVLLSFIFTHAENIPEGCWSDSIALTDPDGCENSTTWMEIGGHFCGQKLYSSSFQEKLNCFGGRRGIDFVCCNAIRPEDSQPPPHLSARFKHHVLTILRQLIWNRKTLSVLEQNNTAVFNSFFQELIPALPKETPKLAPELLTPGELMPYGIFHGPCKSFSGIHKWLDVLREAPHKNLIAKSKNTQDKFGKDLWSKRHMIAKMRSNILCEIVVRLVMYVGQLAACPDVVPSKVINTVDHHLHNYLYHIYNNNNDSIFPDLSEQFNSTIEQLIVEHLWGVPEDTLKSLLKNEKPLKAILEYYKEHESEIYGQDASKTPDQANFNFAAFLFTSLLVAMGFATGLIVCQLLNAFYRGERYLSALRLDRKKKATTTESRKELAVYQNPHVSESVLFERF
ncbi:hypothetical protein L596_017686 [Steinernema carpocapsae]|uniref:Uncharacterized protein n=1 Tax=Steinernema carpocapsae TaxID=34508 RepID=A0A4U5N2D6_STECR|nr:hypothetical protein L596_017686 [Steinernema carpocapsae]